MTLPTRFVLGLSAAAISLGIAFAPAAQAMDKMDKKDSMSKDSMKKDTMGKNGMKKDDMHKDGMSKDHMKK